MTKRRREERSGRAATRLVLVALAAAHLLSLAPAGAAPRADGRGAVKPRYDVEVDVDLDAATYRGRETVTFTNGEGGGVDKLRFDLYPNVGLEVGEEPLLRVTGARIGNNVLQVRDDAISVEVRLPSDVEPGGAVEVALEFEGRAVRREPEEVGLEAHVTDQVAIVLEPSSLRFRKGSDVVTATSDAMLLGNPFPTLAVKRGNKREPTAGDFVLSEQSVYRIAVRAGDGVDVVASGDAAQTDGSTHLFEGASLRNVALFASRGYETLESEAAGIRLRSVHRPKHAAAARRALRALEGAVGVYVDAFGRPPVDEIAVVESPLVPGNSAAAFSGLIAAATAYYTDIRGPEGRDLPGFVRDTPELMEGEIEFAVMRESSRQWWGEGVGSDPRRSALLTDGLSGYSAVVATERLRGAEEASRAVEQRFRTPYRVYRMFGGKDMPADRGPSSYQNYFAYSAIVETKTALFFEALRKEVGDERFFDALRRYYADNAGRIARDESFFEAVGAAAGRDARNRLDRLYDRWITESRGDADVGEPEYAVAVSPDAMKPAAPGSSERRPGAERIGRFVVKLFVQIGKTAAKPF